MERSGPAVHRTIVVVDVEGFGDRRRTNTHQVAVRAGLYKVLRDAFEQAGVSWPDCYHEDRGDGVIVLAPARMPKAPFVDVLPHALVTALREHNTTHDIETRIRLRLALHAGEVIFDQYGVTGSAVNLAFRLLDAAPLKTALAESPGVLAVITSEWFFDEVVRHSPNSDATTYRPVHIAVKETSTVAWISRPDHPYPPAPIHLTDRPVPPPAPRRVMAAHMGWVVVAAGCFIGANFLPIGSGYWTDKSSGVQTAQVTLTFNLFHPLTRAVATGVDGAKVEVSQWLAPFLGLGTAVMLALALLFPVLLRSADPDLRAMGETVYKVCLIWAVVFVFVLVVAEIFSFVKIPDGPGLYSRDEVQPGAWMLFAASAMVADAMQRTGKRLGLPWATQASQRRVQPRNKTPR